MAYEPRGLGVILAVLVLCMYGCKQQQRDVQLEAKEHPTLVQLEDIGNGVEIIGVLDHPLCSLLTVRGKWAQPHSRSKDPALLFRVHSVNGKRPNAKIELNKAQVIAIYSSRRKVGGVIPPDGSWDWKFAMGGKEPVPVPEEGETYEMVGVETCYFDSYPEEVWQVVGSTVPPSPSFRHGFLTRFEFVAMRKIVEK
jgi:hypothetical protein